MKNKKQRKPKGKVTTSSGKKDRSIARNSKVAAAKTRSAKTNGTKKRATAARISPNKKNPQNERRQHRRYQPQNLVVTEISGEYRFVLQVSDISEGGIFLKGRMKIDSEASEIQIPVGLGKKIEVKAQPLYDRVSDQAYGTGYQFTAMSVAQAKQLRSFLRNLD